MLARHLNFEGSGVKNAECSSRSILDHLTSRWGILVLRELKQQNYRFSELRRALPGVSEKMLAQTLRLLEADGVVERRQLEESRRLEYCLTAIGRGAAETVGALMGWIDRNEAVVLLSRGPSSSDSAIDEQA